MHSSPLSPVYYFTSNIQYQSTLCSLIRVRPTSVRSSTRQCRFGIHEDASLRDQGTGPSAPKHITNSTSCHPSLCRRSHGILSRCLSIFPTAWGGLMATLASVLSNFLGGCHPNVSLLSLTVMLESESQTSRSWTCPSPTIPPLAMALMDSLASVLPHSRT